MPSDMVILSPVEETQGLHKPGVSCKVAVIWIDWYAYHVERFRGVLSDRSLAGHAQGIELVGGVGIHAGLKFRENLPSDLKVKTIMPESNWLEVSKVELSQKLWRVLSELQPKVILVPGYYTLPGITSALWAKLHRRKSVLMTESTEEDHARSWWKEALKGLLIRSLFDWAVTGGKAHVRYLKRLGFPEDRIRHFYDVVANETYMQQAALLRRQSHESFNLPRHYFLYIGRLAPEKNIAVLIRAWIEYRSSGGSWSLVLVGDGPSAESLRRIAAESQYPNDVHFAGHKESKELPKYYAFSSCFVLPSTREPWGLVVNEAMASGLPVIVSNRCGSAEDLVIDGDNGYVFNPTDEHELAATLLKMSDADESERLEMGKRSAEIIERYSPENFGREIASIANA
jgi:1,2-diacylglycerol 3-alpha-glucosyltransferase